MPTKASAHGSTIATTKADRKKSVGEKDAVLQRDVQNSVDSQLGHKPATNSPPTVHVVANASHLGAHSLTVSLGEPRATDTPAINLLLVEDDIAQASIIQTLVGVHHRDGLVIAWSQTLAETLQRLRTYCYDVVLLDLNLPDSNGIDTYRLLSQASPDTPVVVLTGNDDRVLALRAVAEGAQDFLVKGSVDGQTVLRSALYAIERSRRERAERQLLNVQEQERKRVARDLHDSVVQSLLSLRLQLQMFGSRMAKDNQAAAVEIEGFSEIACSTADEVRRICRDLHPEVLDRRRLHEAIEWYARRQVVGTGMSLQLHVQPHEPLDSSVNQHLFRMFQEIMRNAIQHSQATTICVELRGEADELVLAVSDDGCGFDAACSDRADSEVRLGLGLISLRERTKLLNGMLLIKSQPGHGSHVSVRTAMRVKEPAQGS